MEPTAPDDGGLSAFLDDYFAECDEHLTGVRRLLLDLEASVGRVAPRAALDELFRHFHLLKGISGMVELRPAEDLAHRMEEYLRSLRVRESVLTSEGLSAFFDGAQLLEQIVGARRSGGSVPAVEAGVAVWGRRLATTMDRVASLADPAEPEVRVPAVTASPRWRLTFIPSQELVARGVRVDTIRKRLASIGEIVQATPHVIGEGTIAFEFVVATWTGEEAFGAWRDDGVTAERLPEEPPAIEPDDVGSTASLKPAGIDSWSGGVAPSHFVRVDLARLDELMRGVGDLVISRARLNEALTRVESHIPSGAWRAVQENAVLIDRQLRTLREGIMRVRLVQVGEIFRRMPFVVRDLARETGKKVQLELRGQSAEIDKFLIERMMDPVLHLVRNAVSHGIETVEERIAAGKRPEATITLAASTAGETVTLEIADDGRGIDREAIAARAAALGLPRPPSSDADALLSLICAPGFSTREQTDRASGRGVGMAVVKTVVEDLAGTLRLETEPGVGTRFIVELPVTLAITDALIAQVGVETFAIPQGAVREVIEVPIGAIRLLEQNEIVPHRGGSLPIVRLARMFGLPESSRDRLHVFVIGTGAAALGIAVDRIVGQREIVVRASKDPLVRVDGISGATDLGDGHVVLIVDPAVLARKTREGRRAAGVTGWTSKVASQ